MCNRARTASIHTLDDDSLLHVFYLCRPFLRGRDDTADWRYNGRWWYALAHVCQRWRNIVLGSASYLGLSLLCTYGTPVADMLAHSPHLPLVIGYFMKDRNLTTEDEEGIILALKQRDRVRRVRIGSAVTAEVFMTMDEEYPILEYLCITLPKEDNSTILRFPETLQAPHLRHLDADWLCPSDRISVTHDCCGSRHTPSCHGSPIHVLPSKYSDPMDFTHATPGDAQNLSLNPLFPTAM
jgi:hypothetical protein